MKNTKENEESITVLRRAGGDTKKTRRTEVREVKEVNELQ